MTEVDTFLCTQTADFYALHRAAQLYQIKMSHTAGILKFREKGILGGC